MNYEYFIAKRLIDSKAYKSNITAPIIKIGIIAIAIGMVVMMIAIATGIGLQQKIRDKVVAFNGHVTISKFDSNKSQETLLPISKQQDFYPEFKAVDGIRHIQGVATKFGVIRTNTDFEGAIYKGVGQDYDWQYFKAFLVQGRLPDFQETWSEEILISQYLANRLRFKLGDSFQMVFTKDDPQKAPNYVKCVVVGIYNSGFQDLDKQYVLGNRRHVQRVNNWNTDQIGSFEVFIEDDSEISQKGQEIYKNTPATFNTQTVEDTYYSIFEWIKIFDKNIYGIIGIMIIIAGINMITALLVLILERTQMIGVLKALGSHDWSVRKLFLYHAAYLVLLGLFWGNLIGLGLLYAQKYFKIFTLDPSVYYVTEAPVYLSLSYLIPLNLGTLILCLVMLLLPTYLVTKISPVVAIRFD